MSSVHIFKNKKGSVRVHSYVANRADPTQVTTYDYTRTDGARFKIVACWGYELLFHGAKIKTREYTEERREVEAWLKKNSLPSMQFVETKLQELDDMYADDGYGYPGQYE